MSSSSSSSKALSKGKKQVLRHLAAFDPSAAAKECVFLLKTKEGRDDVELLVFLGKSQYMLKDAVKACKAYARATEISSSSPIGAWRGLVEVASDPDLTRDRAEEANLEALGPRAFRAVLDFQAAGSPDPDDAKWCETLESYCAFAAILGSDRSTVLEVRSLALSRDPPLPASLLANQLRRYCDLVVDSGGEGDDSGAIDADPDLRDRLRDLYAITRDDPEFSAYHRRYLRSLACSTSKQDDAAALEVATTLIDHFEEDAFVAERAMDLCLAADALVEHDGGLAADLVSERGFPPTLVASARTSRLITSLVHRRPWEASTWLGLGKVAMQRGSLTTASNDSNGREFGLSPLSPQSASSFARNVVKRKAQAAVKAEPKVEKHWVSLGEALASTHPEKSIKCLEKSNHPTTLLLRAMVLNATKRHAQTLALLEGGSPGSFWSLIHSRCRAEALMGLKKWDRAEAELREILLRHPNHHRTLADLGWATHKMGKLQEACELLERSVQLAGSDPSDVATCHYRLGRSYWKREGAFRQDRSFAYTSFLKAASSASADPVLCSRAFRSLGHYYLVVSEDKPRALRCYRKAVERDPERKGAGRAACALLREQNKDLEIIEACDQSLSDPRSLVPPRWPLLPLAHALARTKQYDRALPVFRKAIRSAGSALGPPESRQCWEGLGLCYRETRSYQNAIKAYQRAASVCPESAFAWLELGRIQAEVFLDHAAALRLFGRARAVQDSRESHAMALAHASCGALLNLARQFAKIGAHGAAHGAVQEGLRALPALRCLGRTHWKMMGDFSIESVHLEKASRQFSAPSDGGGGGGGGEDGDAEGRARRAYAKALHLSPFHSGSWHDLALCFHLRGEQGHQRARALVLRGLRINSGDPALWAAAGIVETSPKIKEYCFARSLQLDSASADTWVCLASLYLAHSRLDLARECLQTARMHNASCPFAWECEALARKAQDPTFDAKETYEYCLRLSANPLVNRAYGLEVALASEGATDAQRRRALLCLDLTMECPDLANDPLAQYCRGALLEHFGEHQRAVGAYRETLREIEERSRGEALGTIPMALVMKSLARALVKSHQAEEALQVHRELSSLANFEWDPPTLVTYLCAKDEAGQLTEADLGLDHLGSDNVRRLQTKLRLKRVLEGQGGGVEAGIRMVVAMEGDNGGEGRLVADSWLLVLGFGAKVGEGVDLAVAHMVASPLWGEMEAEAAKILAEGHAARGDGAQARAWFAKALHSDPLDRCSWSSLFHWSSPEGKFGCLVPLAAQDESGTILTLVKAGRTRNESTQRRMLAKCLHQYPERPELWAMRPGLA